MGGEDVSVKAKIAWTNVGDIELELIEPQDDNSVYARRLRSNGPGVHHLMFGAGDYQDAVDSMRENGLENIVSGALQATSFQLFDTVEMLGTITEFAEGDALTPDKKSRPYSLTSLMVIGDLHALLASTSVFSSCDKYFRSYVNLQPKRTYRELD